MTTKTYATIDGNEAVARVAYRLSEVIAIYPITPSSPMGEWSDSWSAERRANLWGTIPSVIEMQSEGGAAGTLHGALQTGSLTTTFTSSQGLLLMLPNFYKIAGELTSSVVHVAARALAAQGLSIFGDHSDVMSARSTGWAMLAANSVQEAQDLAAIATATTLETRIPFLHFFDGFRTSHEVQKVELISDETLKELIDEDLIIAHRQRALTPDRPVLRGTAQNPDVYFQARESVNPFYYACPDIAQKIMDRFAQLTGRQYHLYEYHGAPDAERVIMLMGSGGETVHETVDYLNQNGAKVGVLKVRLYRPFAAEKLLAALPTTVKKIAVLDRCKEPGAGGDPLYLDVVNAFMEEYEGKLPKIVGGRYGLSSKEFTPAMIAGIFDNLSLDKPKNHFTIGIVDDLTFSSLEYDRSFSTEPDEVVRAVFYGEEVFSHLPRHLQQTIIDKNLQVYTINATQVAKEAGMGSRINTVMQVCFFALAGVLSREDAIAQIKKAIRKTYGKKGEEIVQMNIKAVDSALEHLYQVPIPATVTPEAFELRPPIPDSAPTFVREVLGKIIARHGDELPVSALPNDGTYPTATSQWEKRNIAQEIPVWDADVCVQCGKCVLVCPHAVIRSKVYDEAELATAPETFKVANAKDHDWKGLKFTIQVAAEDCTGCGLCVDVCPAKNKSQPRLRAINMAPQLPLREQERVNWDFFLNLPNPDRLSLNLNKINHQQMQEPLFEFSGACAGCGETPYVKLVSQLFGDRMIVANATGCSSIYGGNLPTTPWAVNAEGRGPAWSNSLFEDNAEFGLGFRVSIDKQAEFAAELLGTLASEIGESLAADILNCHQVDEAEIYEQRHRVEALKSRLGQLTPTTQVKMLLSVADYLVKKSVWIVGGDGWAYDIGYGGLDHVLASGRNVNILVMDTEVYSNTGGQASKATPRAAVAKFASGGKPGPKKDLGLMAMTYGNVYVASVAMGAKNEQTIKAFLEAEAYNGPSLIIAYSHCIAHGINMTTAMNHQKEVVESGRWLMYRYHPDLAKEGKNPLQLDSRAPKLTVAQTLYSENRFKMLATSKPEEAKRLLKEAQADVDTRWQMYQYLAAKGTGSNE